MDKPEDQEHICPAKHVWIPAYQGLFIKLMLTVKCIVHSKVWSIRCLWRPVVSGVHCNEYLWKTERQTKVV